MFTYTIEHLFLARKYKVSAWWRAKSGPRLLLVQECYREIQEIDRSSCSATWEVLKMEVGRSSLQEFAEIGDSNAFMLLLCQIDEWC